MTHDFKSMQRKRSSSYATTGSVSGKTSTSTGFSGFSRDSHSTGSISSRTVRSSRDSGNGCARGCRLNSSHVLCQRHAPQSPWTDWRSGPCPIWRLSEPMPSSLMPEKRQCCYLRNVCRRVTCVVKYSAALRSSDRDTQARGDTFLNRKRSTGRWNGFGSMAIGSSVSFLGHSKAIGALLSLHRRNLRRP